MESRYVYRLVGDEMLDTFPWAVVDTLTGEEIERYNLRSTADRITDGLNKQPTCAICNEPITPKDRTEGGRTMHEDCQATTQRNHPSDAERAARRDRSGFISDEAWSQ